MSNSQQKRASSSIITDAWYNGAFWLYLLAPVSLVYAFLIRLRRLLYRSGILSSYRSKLPIVVVGNLTVGGTGKSPLVAYLVRSLRAKGYTPGVISRGYGASIANDECREVLLTSLASEVGDEPLMLKLALDCPVLVSPNRRLSVEALEAHGCDIIISDDGLQHYALQRSVEICVFDGLRGIGNQYLLPMGPMREGLARLGSIGFKVVNGASNIPGLESVEDLIRMELVPGELRPLKQEHRAVENTECHTLESLKGRKVNAVAAIGNPERFFSVLEGLGLIVNRYAFEDHHAYESSDFDFEEALPIIMTEKDAVKCRELVLADAWYLPVEAQLSEDLASLIIEDI